MFLPKFQESVNYPQGIIYLYKGQFFKHIKCMHHLSGPILTFILCEEELIVGEES